MEIKTNRFANISQAAKSYIILLVNLPKRCLSLPSAVARYQILGGHTVNRGIEYDVHHYVNLKILGGHVPVCPPYEYGPVGAKPQKVR